MSDIVQCKKIKTNSVLLSAGKLEGESPEEEEFKSSSKSSSKDNSLHAQLSRYLLKTLASEVTNTLFNLAAAEVLMKVHLYHRSKSLIAL